MKKIIVFLALLLIVSLGFAQNVGNIDLSKLSPEQIEMYTKYMKSQKSSTSGMQMNDENSKIIFDRRLSDKDTLPNFQQFNNQVLDNKGLKAGEKEMTEAEYRKALQQKLILALKEFDKKQIFGAYLFDQKNLTFEPKLNIPTPVNYVFGQGDEVQIDISGYHDVNFKLKVNPEGTIRIPNVGPVKVAGKSVSEAERIIRSEISKKYQGVNTGETKVAISLGNIRSIKISVIGNAVKPGSYTLPSVATVFNALYSCGGPNESGSMRNIKVFRNNQEISTIDVYDFLKNGSLKGNVILQEGDVIKIEAYENRITVVGGLKNIGLFESVKNENLSELINVAGGFCDTTNQEICTVKRLEKNQKRIFDVNSSDYSSFTLNGGDEISFTGISNQFKNRIYITGSVIRPGLYAFSEGLTMQKLLLKSGGLKEDAFKDVAFIYRKNENKIPEMRNFNLKDLIEGRIEDVMIQRDDSVVIRSSLDYQAKKTVVISGEVRFPGTYEMLKNMSVIDLISKARGFTEIALNDSVELIKTVKDKNLLNTSGVKSIVYKIKIDKKLNPDKSESSMALEDGDQVVVRRIPGYENLRMVKIEGEVIRPGGYNIISKNERVSDVVRRSGGFTEYAHIDGAFLIRNQKFDEAQKKLNDFMKKNAVTQIKDKNTEIDVDMLEKTGLKDKGDINAIDSLQMNLSGAEIVDKIADAEGLVGIDLQKIIDNPHGDFDLILEDGDLIYIPRQLQTVRVIGEVYFPTYIKYQRNYNFNDYLSGAGGESSKADKKRIFVLYPNGTSKSTKSFLGIKSYPKVLPGSQIIVPQKSNDLKEKLSAGESISIASTTASMLALVYSIISQTLLAN